MINLKKILSSASSPDLDDVLAVKRALHKAGYYEVPDYGLTPYPDKQLFQSIKDYQEDYGLKVDGVMKPEGETVAHLNRKIRDGSPNVKSPTMWCTECGGPHGGSKGDVCPDCFKK